MPRDAGGNNTKKSLDRTFAVIWEGAEGTQEVSSQPRIRGTRFARTMMSENTHIQTTAHCARVRRRGRGIRYDSIGTPSSEDSLPVPFYTRVLNASRGNATVDDDKLGRLARVSTLFLNYVSAPTACRKRQ